VLGPPTRNVSHPWAHSLVWLEHPADNREVVGSNPTGPIPRQGIAPSKSHRLPLGSGKRGFQARLQVVVEHREPFGHLLLPDSDVVRGLVELDVPEDPLEVGTRLSGVTGPDGKSRPDSRTSVGLIAQSDTSGRQIVVVHETNGPTPAAAEGPGSAAAG
jgi:hypothetical protein